MAASENILTVPEKSQQALLEYIRLAATIQDEGFQLRNRLEDVDKLYMLENDYTEEQRKASIANKRGDPTKLQNIQVPLVMESVETSVSFLSQVYLSSFPMFTAAGDPEIEDLALMWNTLIGGDQIYYGWAGEFNIAFRNGEKYNFAPLEIDWCQHRKYVPVNSATSGQVVEQQIWQGNRIKSLDPYNFIYDPRVPIHKLHDKGEFAGYIELLSRIEVKRFLANLGTDRLKNDVAALESPSWEIQHYIPFINPNVTTRNRNWQQGQFNWTAWAFGDAQTHIKYGNMYTVVTLYVRIMPYEFGIRAPRDQTPDVWKLVAINNILVWAAPLNNAHDYLPIVVGSPNVDNLNYQTKANAENQAPFQSMTTALWNAKLASARRRTTDRMIYNPLLIDPDHINSPNPSAKIPIRPTAYGRKLEEAVYVIPFHDENSQFFIQEAEGVAKWGMRAQGQNNVSVGQFQKGNKLQSEFDQTMANAGARDRTKALMWDVFTMTPIKEIIKSNYLQFTPAGTRYNIPMQKQVTIDPVKLRQQASELSIGDGLLPSQKLAKTEDMQAAFTYMAQDPSIGAQYNRGPMFSYMMKLRGIDKLSKFEKSPEQMQYEQALAAWQNAAKMLSEAKGIETMKPEDLAKILGPMPQPPKLPTQQSKQGANQNASY